MSERTDDQTSAPQPSWASPVPHPVERRIVIVVAEGQDISEEQRQRVCAWLEANGIDANRVVQGPITVESTMHGDREGRAVIAFREYYEDRDGKRVINEKTLEDALTYDRWVQQKVPLEPDPMWASRRAQMDEKRESST